jgi:hypothetical protein
MPSCVMTGSSVLDSTGTGAALRAGRFETCAAVLLRGALQHVMPEPAQAYLACVLCRVLHCNCALAHHYVQVRQDGQERFYVDGLTQARCPTAAVALKHIGRGLTWRHTRAHKLNQHSSRSHCLITLELNIREVGPGCAQHSGVCCCDAKDLAVQ